MTWDDRRKRFRTTLAGERCVFLASVFDPISARIAEDLEYEVGILAGSIASMAVLGAPDLIVLTLSEFAELAYRISRAGHLPLLVDADHGYGNALNVRRTVEELEAAGVAALTIEDTILPTAFGQVGKISISSIEEGIGKMRAALDARQDIKLAIIGRTSAAIVNGIDDAIIRGNAYVAAGVDAMCFIGIKTREQLELLHDAIKVPIVLGSPEPDLQDLDYLSSRGVRILNLGHQTFPAAMHAVHAVLTGFREGGPAAKLTNLASGEFMARVTRSAQYKAWERSYLGEK